MSDQLIIEVPVDDLDIRIESELEEIRIDAEGVWPEVTYVISSIGDNVITIGGDYVIVGG